jgi:hypothetical protein
MPQEDAGPLEIPYSAELREFLGEHRTVLDMLAAREPFAPPQVRAGPRGALAAPAQHPPRGPDRPAWRTFRCVCRW